MTPVYVLWIKKLKAKRLTEITYECLYRGIDMVKPGNTFGDIIKGFKLCGIARLLLFAILSTRIGQDFHEPPNVSLR